MSRTTKIEEQSNPAKATIQWSSVESCYTWYDKTKKENVKIEKPFSFVVLEQDYCSFNGFNEDAGKGFWSNEVKEANDLVTVKLGMNDLISFKKSEWKGTKEKPGFKDEPKLKGCKYTQILYVAAKLEDDTEEQIYRIMITGAALSGGITVDKKTGKPHPDQETDGWFNFLKSLGSKKAVYNNIFIIDDFKSKKNGAVNYTLPVYTVEPLDESTEDKYNEMAEVVNEWFVYYNGKKETTTSSVEPLKEEIKEENNIVSEETKEEKPLSKTAMRKPVHETIDTFDLHEDDEDLPF